MPGFSDANKKSRDAEDRLPLISGSERSHQNSDGVEMADLSQQQNQGMQGQSWAHGGHVRYVRSSDPGSDQFAATGVLPQVPLGVPVQQIGGAGVAQHPAQFGVDPRLHQAPPPPYGQYEPGIHPMPGVPPVIIPVAQRVQDQPQEFWGSLAIFIAGCFMPIVWCGGWFFVHHSHRPTRLLARISVGIIVAVFACIALFMIMMILGMGTMINQANAHCHSFSTCQDCTMADSCAWCPQSNSCNLRPVHWGEDSDGSGYAGGPHGHHHKHGQGKSWHDAVGVFGSFSGMHSNRNHHGHPGKNDREHGHFDSCGMIQDTILSPASCPSNGMGGQPPHKQPPPRPYPKP